MKECFSKGETYFSRGKGREHLMPPRFVVPPPVSHGRKWHVVQHKKFPQKLTISQKKKKKKDADSESFGEKVIS